MEVQSECVEPPVVSQCDPQPTGRINKAAFKLFGKQRTGSGMASFFSFRNKAATNSENGNSLNGSSSVASVELVRSKTHDGLTGSNNDADGQKQEALATLESGPVRSLSKSLSFFSFLRRGSFRSSEHRGAGLVRRGRGLKGFFSSMRWRRKEKTNEGDGELESKKEEGETSDSDKVKDVTLTLQKPLHHQEDFKTAKAATNHPVEATRTTCVTMSPPHCAAMSGPAGEPDSVFPYTPTDSPLHPFIQNAKASISSLTPSLATPPLDRCSTGDPPSEPSVDRICSLLFNDVTSLKSFDSLTGCGDIIADADEEGPAGNGESGTSSSSSGGGAGASLGVGVCIERSVGLTGITSRGSPSKTPNAPTMIQPIFSVTPHPAPASQLPRTRVTQPPQQHPAGSGVVAYMGGGEEMASPEGVDDSDMQGLWHMLPSTGDNSPALPRSQQPSTTTPTSTYPVRTTPTSSHLPSAPRTMDRNINQVKVLGLSKIPVVGGAVSRSSKPPLPHGRHPASPGEKEPFSDEGYWDTPTATPTATPDDSRLQHNKKTALPLDSCSGDHLYDLYNDPEEEGELQGGEDLISSPSPSTEYKMSPTSPTSPPSSSSSSSFRSLKGSTSLPRESKIPVSACKNPPPHSASQSALSSVLESESPPPKNQPPPPTRTRIPISKVPVRKTGNQPTKGISHKK